MSLSTKAFLLNFLSSAGFFLGFRFGLPYLLALEPLWTAVAAGVLAILLAPKFLITPDRKNPKLVMRWFFSKKQ
ncbi:MAG: hypothetical protein KKC03_06335 [Bacteroidetes bacterium]|nr:hypothetical protein [Bacteroidota bacterium]